MCLPPAARRWRKDAERLKDLASEAPVIRLVNQMIGRAVETQASDIHIEPFEDRLRVRYRYDGVLHEADSPPARLAPAIISRIKIMAQARHRRAPPAAGRAHPLAVRGRRSISASRPCPRSMARRSCCACSTAAAWCSITRSWACRQVVDRLLRENAGAAERHRAGDRADRQRQDHDALYRAARPQRGRAQDRHGRGPDRVSAAGINQIQVKPQIGLSFRQSAALDPAPGSGRDHGRRNPRLETAQIAVQAALTGHLVLSTLHTNSAAATITRLRDMGLEDYLLTAVLRGVLAQRLVRRLCPHASGRPRRRRR
jgi:general secretion pathway protein E